MDARVRARQRVSQVSGVVGVLFGLATIAAGGSVLAGRDPGYVVYRPLLLFNTLMGLLYVVAGVLAWRRARAAWSVAAGIAGANLLVLAYIVLLYRAGGPTAIDSVRAMVLRTGVWLALLLTIVWAQRETDRHSQ
jgi:hypothetical protein